MSFIRKNVVIKNRKRFDELQTQQEDFLRHFHITGDWFEQKIDGFDKTFEY